MTGLASGEGNAPPRVVIFSAYRFHVHALARELSKRGLLAAFYTAMPRRLVTDIPRRRVHSRPIMAVTREAVRRVARDSGLMTRAVIYDFDRWASGKVQGGEVSYALSSFATTTLGKSKALGNITICDRGSWHIQEQQLILQREQSLWGLPGPGVDSWIIDRELREYDSVDAIIVPSTAARASFVRQGVDGRKVYVNNLGVDLSRFWPGPEEQRIPGRVLCVGALSLRKGQQYLLDAYRRTRGSTTSLQLVGAFEPSFRERFPVDQPDVILTGALPQKQVADAMRQASIFCLASVEEGLAMVIVQAMASGLPVVVSDATGGADVVVDGETGYVVPAGDVTALAERLQELLAKPRRAKEMGRKAYEWARASGGWGEYGKRAAALIRQIAN